MDLNAETRWILGRPNFACAGIASALRKDGREIKEKSEDEQAAAIHWMICLWEIHGDKWRDVAEAELKRIAATVPSGETGK